MYPYGDQNDREAVPASAGSGVYRQLDPQFYPGDDRIRQYDEVESLVDPSQAFAEGGIHEAIMAYEDTTFFEILAQELALQDMDDPPSRRRITTRS